MQAQKRTKVAFHTMGCRSNFSDTVELQTACLERGYIPTEAGDEADVFVLKYLHGNRYSR